MEQIGAQVKIGNSFLNMLLDVPHMGPFGRRHQARGLFKNMFLDLDVDLDLDLLVFRNAQCKQTCDNKSQGSERVPQGQWTSGRSNAGRAAPKQKGAFWADNLI